ncbi:MAG: cyclic nucleotide-binding/CBS domain-containing protein [Candidatus Nanoarchaeia archaeon]
MNSSKDIMKTNVMTMDVNEGFEGVLELILNTKTDYIIITKNDKPVGIITERDIIKKLLANRKKKSKIKLEDVMKKNIISVNSNYDINRVSELMHNENIRHIPVIEEGKLLGIITSTDIVKFTSEIQEKNKRFSIFQNIQTGIIIAFFIFLVGYFLMQMLS